MANAATPNTTTAKNVTNGANETTTHPFTDKAQATLQSSVDRLAQTAARAEENIRASAADSADNMSARKAEMDAKWKSSGVRKYAVENPVAAAGIAFAAGMLVTSLLRKK
jgi:ElaB/YqjD/DUF883 family membrane-anchored ribosome-binding protein